MLHCHWGEKCLLLCRGKHVCAIVTKYHYTLVEAWKCCHLGLHLDMIWSHDILLHTNTTWWQTCLHLHKSKHLNSITYLSLCFYQIHRNLSKVSNKFIIIQNLSIWCQIWQHCMQVFMSQQQHEFTNNVNFLYMYRKEWMNCIGLELQGCTSHLRMDLTDSVLVGL